MEEELLRSLGKKPVTLLFPHEQAELVEGIRAKPSWLIENCVGCNLCVRICPSRAIKMMGKQRDAEIIYDVGRCIFCGECVDVCPTKAVYTTKEFALAFIRPRQMIIEFKRPKKRPKPSSKE
jgi:formate hydrogenlyase subunit 6/NADH:ubiquinone oxidoreductase subunit I